MLWANLEKSETFWNLHLHSPEPSAVMELLYTMLLKATEKLCMWFV